MEVKHLTNRVNIPEFPMKLDLGCGQFLKEGFQGMDWADYGQAIVWDAKNGFPLPDNSVCELYTSHFLEHLEPTEYHFVLHEIWRVCQNGAKITIKVPHGDTWQGCLPCHYNRITEMHFYAIDNWLRDPLKEYTDNTNYIQVEKVFKIEYHLIGEFIVHKA
jgi:hypothetical protein